MSQYEIPRRVGYTKELTFRIAPVSKAIMNADADWLYDDELCIDNAAATALLRPFLDEYLKKPFKAHDEINVMAFSRVRLLIDALTETSTMLLEHYDEPVLKSFKNYIPLDVVLPPEERDKAALASRAEKERLLKDNIDVVTNFYGFVADHLSAVIKDFGAKGFRHIAITSPV